MKDLDDVEPRTALRNDFVSLMPIVISSPGSYYLAEDIYALFGEHGIEITASHVTLDLNGFSVIGNIEVGSLAGIRCDVGTRGIVVKNGTVRDFFEEGVMLFTCPNSRVERVTAVNNGLGGSRNGIYLGQDSMAIECIAANNTRSGFRSDFGSIFYRCIAADNGLHGIDSHVAVVDGCMARGNTGDGITASTGSVLHSVAASNTDDGIDPSNALVQSNSATGNTGDEIVPDAGSVQTENNE